MEWACRAAIVDLKRLCLSERLWGALFAGNLSVCQALQLLREKIGMLKAETI